MNPRRLFLLLAMLGACSRAPVMVPDVHLGDTAKTIHLPTNGPVRVEVENSVVVKITITRQGRFSARELDALLAANAGNRSWSEVPAKLDPVGQQLGIRRWRRGDRGSATLSERGGESELVLAGPPAMRPTHHRLTWKRYDGTGDPAAAQFVVDDQMIGDLAALKQFITSLPIGSELVVVPYYGDPGGTTKRAYPFNVEELRQFAASHVVRLLVPQGK